MEQIETTQIQRSEEQFKVAEEKTGKEGSQLARSEEMLKKWLLDRDYKTKLACLMMNTLNNDDHGTGRLFDEIISSYEAEILSIASNPPENLSKDELLMTGVVVELGIWHAHY